MKFISTLRRWLCCNHHFLITLGCCVVFTIQLSFLIPGYIRPTQLNTVMERILLQEMEDFPLVFRVCVRPGFNISRLQELGYPSMEEYFWGWMDDNYTDIGWAGRGRNSSIMSPGGKFGHTSFISVSLFQM